MKHVDGRAVLVEHGWPAARALVLVGDRILSVQVRDRETTQLLAVLRQVLPTLTGLPAWPVTTRNAACEKAGIRANAALGGRAVVRRDGGSAGSLTCGWSTHDAYVWVHARGGADFAPSLRREAAQSAGSAVHGIGDAATYSPGRAGSPSILRIASHRHLITIEGAGGKVHMATLTAVAKAVVGNY